MRTTESKYTLIVADLQWNDMKPDTDTPSPVHSILDEISHHSIELGRGMFLFDTEQDYHLIYKLVDTLARARRGALMLPIESELHFVGDIARAKTISDAYPDLKLYRVAMTATQ
jgi:hypothetical protein